MRIRQLSIFLENKPKQLSSICSALADAKINILALSLADTSDFGIVRMIVDNHEKAKAVLADHGRVANVREVVAVCVPDRPGGMVGVMQVLDKVGVDIEYSYAFASSRGDWAVLVFRFSDNARAEEALREAKFTVLSEEDVFAN